MCHTGGMAPDPEPLQTTVLRLRAVDRIVLLVVAAGVGAGVGLALPLLMGWVEQLPWFPWEGPRELLRALSGQLGSWILTVLGLVLGLALGALMMQAATRVEITDREIVVIPDGKDSERRRFARAEVDRVLIEDRHLVIRDVRDVDLTRCTLEVPKDQVIAALRQHGWPHEPQG